MANDMLASLNLLHEHGSISGVSNGRSALPADADVPAGPGEARQDGTGTEPTIRSSETAFVEAARSFDPHAITRSQVASMAALLLGRGAISDRDHLILKTDPTAGRMAVARDLAAPRDAIKDWQERRTLDMERGRVGAVEASTRALAILGRLVALRGRGTDGGARV